MKKLFTVLMVAAVLVVGSHGTLMAQTAANETFNITAELQTPMTIVLDVALIEFGPQQYGAPHLVISALNPIVADVTGDANENYDVTLPATVQMDGPGADTFNVTLAHDAGAPGLLDGTGADSFTITATIAGNELQPITVPGAYQPAAPVTVTVDYP